MKKTGDPILRLVELLYAPLLRGRTAGRHQPNHLSNLLMVVMLPDSFRGMRAWKNSTETQRSGLAPRSGPKIKNGRSRAKDGAPETLGYGTIQEEVSQILQRVSVGAAW